MTLTINSDKFDEELMQELCLVSNEFQSFGLPSLEEFYPYRRLLLMQLIDNIHNLMRIHRNLLEQTNEINMQQTNSLKEISFLNKLVDSTKYELSINSHQLNALKQSTCMMQIELDEVKNENKKLKDQIKMLKNQMDSKLTGFNHKLKQLEEEKMELTNKLSLGTFKPKDLYIYEALNKYKLKEDIYKETIKELEDNNKAILEEMLSLRETIVDQIANRS